MTNYIYGARDKVTGKLVSDIVSPRRKYWDKKGNAEKSINAHNKAVQKGYRNSPNEVELVEFKLIETNKENNSPKEQLKILNSLLSTFDARFAETQIKEANYLADPDESDEDRDIEEAFYEGILNGIMTCMEIIRLNIKRLS